MAYGDSPAIPTHLSAGTADEIPRELGYATFFETVTRTANAFAALGLGWRG